MLESARRGPGPPARQPPGEGAISGQRSAIGRSLRLSLLAIVAFLLAFAGLAPQALAVPAEIIEAKNEAAALRVQIEALNESLEQAIEDYQYATVRLERTRREVAVNQAQLERAEKDLDKASARLEERIRGIYVNGKLRAVEALFSARSFSEFVNRFSLLARIGAHDSEIKREVSEYRNQVLEKKRKLAADLEEEKVLVAEARAARARISDKLAEHRRLLQGKEDQIAELERQEAARQARLAALAREAAREAAARALAPRRSASSGGGSAAPAQGVPHSGRGGSVVEIASRYLGVPYVWGGAGPGGFDCSGLVMNVYSQVGVSLPHSSRAQFGYGVPVSRSELEPGDLVFFGSPIHHVGIYVGNGTMIHAPYTGACVRYNSVDRRNYVGARRIL